MKFDFDDFNFKDEIELINIQRQMQNEQFKNNQSLGLNTDTLYNFIEDKK